MKKKTTTRPRKLDIDLETIRTLSDTELVNVAGGFMNNSFMCPPTVTNPCATSAKCL